jgi:hypothetical protein
MIDPERIEWWQCTIGPIKRKEIGWGGDFPLRQAVKEKFEEVFDTIDYEVSSGWGTTHELMEVISSIRNLSITDPSGETLAKIKAALDENRVRHITSI